MFDEGTKTQTGVGRRVLGDGRIVEGFFFNGSLFGHAKEVHVDGEAFVGIIDNYIRNGKGVLHSKEGDAESNGEWVNGKRRGTLEQQDPQESKGKMNKKHEAQEPNKESKKNDNIEKERQQAMRP